MLCLHQQENFYPTSCLSNEKHSKGDKTMDYLANYPCSIESVSQIEKQLWHKLRNILSLNPVSIRIMQVLQTRSRISKPTFIKLMLRSDCNWTRTQNHLFRKRTLSLVKWLSVCLQTKWFWVWVQLQSLNL